MHRNDAFLNLTKNLKLNLTQIYNKPTKIVQMINTFPLK